MKIRTVKFRCDLCGEYRKVGVTETKPLHPEQEGSASTQTCVCSDCIATGVKLLAAQLEADEHEAS